MIFNFESFNAQFFLQAIKIDQLQRRASSLRDQAKIAVSRGDDNELFRIIERIVLISADLTRIYHA